MVIVDEIVPGMILAEDVYDRSGRFLVAKGMQITAKHIRILKIWGITSVGIVATDEKNVEVSNVSEIDPELIGKAAQKLAGRFSRMDMDNEVVRELFRVCTVRKARKMMSEKDPGIELETEEIRTEPISPDSECAFKHRDEPRLSPFDLVRKEIKLPALPCIFYQINDAINNPRSCARDIADVIKNDTSLSARLLRLANSVIFGFRAKIDTISRAVVVIGTKEIGNLALGITIMTHFSNIPSHIIDMKLFWKHNIACAIAARIIAGYKRIANLERLFVGGLLHDIGRLIVCKYMPHEMLECVQRAHAEKKLLYEVESEALGLKHSTIGALILKEWKLPVSLENMVKYHHQPLQVQDNLEPAIVSLADIIVNAAEIGSSGEALVPPLSPEVWSWLDLPQGIFTTVLKQVDRQLAEFFRIFGNGA